jgi:flagellar L-ring protein precursor FlgH
MRRKRELLAALFIVAVFLFSLPAGATSLWSDESRAVFVKSARHQVGDLLTLIIVEQSSAVSQNKSQGQEEIDFHVGPGEGLLTNLLPYVGAGAGSSYSGSGSANTSSQLHARLTVTVVAIEPGTGNLLVEGRQKIRINQEEQDLIVRGRIRPEDVRADNTILSSYMADAEIEYEGKGAIANHNRPGIITRFFSWLF